MTAPEIIYDMPIEDYHAHPAISKSGLDLVNRSPRHYQYERLESTEKKDRTHFAVGKAFHTLVLEPHLAEQSIVVRPSEWPTKKDCGILIEDQKAAFAALHADKIIISAADKEMVARMADGVRSHPAANVVLAGNGKPEVSVFWTDPATGVRCRARFDWLREDGLIVDLKSARNANPVWFESDAYKHRYHVQDAFYSEAYRQVFGFEPKGFVFVAAEKEEPFLSGVFYATEEHMELGTLEYRKDLETYAKCLETGVWHGYPDTIMPLNLPGYALRKLQQIKNGDIYV